MMQPRRADIGAAMIAYGTKHSRLQVPKSHVVRKAAGVDLGVVVAVRIAAGDDDMRSGQGYACSLAAGLS
jgi:hypothetical protein